MPWISKLPPSLQEGTVEEEDVLYNKALPDPVHIDADLGIPGVNLDLVDVSLQPVVKLVQAHAP